MEICHYANFQYNSDAGNPKAGYKLPLVFNNASGLAGRHRAPNDLVDLDGAFEIPAGADGNAGIRAKAFPFGDDPVFQVSGVLAEDDGFVAIGPGAKDHFIGGQFADGAGPLILAARDDVFGDGAVSNPHPAGLFLRHVGQADGAYVAGGAVDETAVSDDLGMLNMEKSSAAGPYRIGDFVAFALA